MANLLFNECDDSDVTSFVAVGASDAGDWIADDGIALLRLRKKYFLWLPDGPVRPTAPVQPSPSPSYACNIFANWKSSLSCIKICSRVRVRVRNDLPFIDGNLLSIAGLVSHSDLMLAPSRCFTAADRVILMFCKWFRISHSVPAWLRSDFDFDFVPIRWGALFGCVFDFWTVLAVALIRLRSAASVGGTTQKADRRFFDDSFFLNLLEINVEKFN